MMRMREINKEVFFADEPIVSVTRSEIDFLRARFRDNERKRIRLCAHRNIENMIHEMFLVIGKETYIRPHKHLDGSESLHVIEGSLDVLFFDEAGNVAEVISLGDYASGQRFYYRIADPVYHTLLVRSDPLIYHETKQGPFVRSSVIPAPWAPDEGDAEAAQQFMKQLELRVAEPCQP